MLQCPAATVAAAWATCTELAVSSQLSAISWIKGPARKSGAFLFWGRVAHLIVAHLIVVI